MKELTKSCLFSLTLLCSFSVFAAKPTLQTITQSLKTQGRSRVGAALFTKFLAKTAKENLDVTKRLKKEFKGVKVSSTGDVVDSVVATATSYCAEPQEEFSTHVKAGIIRYLARRASWGTRKLLSKVGIDIKRVADKNDKKGTYKFTNGAYKEFLTWGFESGINLFIENLKNKLTRPDNY